MSPPVRGFALTGAARACATAEGAYANCLALSARYARWLRERGEPAGMIALRGSRAAFPSAAGRWPRLRARGLHALGDLQRRPGVDWTLAPVRPGRPWPVVLPVEVVAAGWRESEVWACATCPDLLADRRHGDLAPPAMHAEHLAIARATGGAGLPGPAPRLHRGTRRDLRLCGGRGG